MEAALGLTRERVWAIPLYSAHTVAVSLKTRRLGVTASGVLESLVL